jgi:hypothetical protein
VKRRKDEEEGMRQGRKGGQGFEEEEGGPVDGFWVNLGWGEWARATTVVFSGPEPNMIRWSAMVEKGASRRNRVMESSRRIGEGKEDKNGEYWIT